MKTPPDRAGIIFEVGAQLEARERHKKWYSATIKKIDCDRERVLVHYQHWSHRHDEWFQWNSPLLRPLERVSLRRQGLSPPHSPVVFAAGMKVLACWTDCRFYPAKILSVNRDNSYKVRFYDGVVRTVKPTKVKPFQENSRAEKTAVGSEDWEDGGSEEESAEEKQKEGEDKKDVEEKVTADEREGGENEEEEEEKKRKAERPSCHSPAKKQADGSTSSGVQNELLTGDPPLLVPPKLPHIDRDVLLERQAHLPTTHKFSREPLYRVIKNQPPPILSIELDHNPFKCPAAGCSKSFRKASLLHYHIKYYHSEQQVDACVGEEPPRRRRSSSKRDDFVPGLKSGDQIQTCHHDDRDPGPLETGELQQDAGGEKTGQDRKDRRNFLRVKLKKKKKLKKRKKKKRKSQPGLCSSDDEISDKPAVPLKPCEPPNTPSQVDDGSDWSTLTAESGEDTPPWPVGMETEECELVRCVCEVDEENDFMIQCESCLCWQHGTCMGLYEDNVPQNYICYYCRHFAGWRRAQHFLSEPDLLISGQMFGLSCVKENYSQINSSKISHTSHLLGHVQVLTQVLSGLKLQMAMLHSPSNPELKLWRLPWKREEGVLCYVSSEHCYQKPGASWETPDEARQWKAAVKEEQEDRTAADVCREVLTRSAGRAETQTRGCEDAAAQAPTLEPRTASVAECQLNLLEHVEALHHQISSRMDLIERELDVLESWLDHSGELEPPDPLSRLPQLKQRIRWLLHDLCTVRRLSFWR